MTPPQAAIHTTTDASQLSKSCAKLFDWMNAISATVPTIETITATIHRFARMSSDNAASVDEYRFRMFVATGPCMIRNSTGIEKPPNAAATRSAGSASVPALATDAPTNASQTVGMKTPSAVDQNTFRSPVPG